MAAPASAPLMGSAAVQAGIDAGNINLQSANTATIGLSEASIEAQERHAEMIRRVEAQRLSRTVAVPTAPEDVIAMLRSMGLPITMFGERVGDRRERLRLTLAEREVDGQGPVPTAATSAGAAQGAKVATRSQVVHTHASASLIEARIQLGAWSLEQAQSRLAAQRTRANAPDAAALTRAEDTQALETFKQLRRLHVAASLPGDPRRAVSAVAYSACDSSFASASWSAEVRLWSRHSMEVVRSFRGHTERVSSLSWRPGAGVDLAAAAEGGDADGDVALTGEAPPSAPGPVIFATGAADCTVRLWGAGSSEAAGVLQGHTGRVARVAWHPNGQHIASASYDTTWRLWDAATGTELLNQDGHAREVYPIAFHPDGSLVATGDLGGIGRVWDLRSGKSVLTLTGHVTQLLALDFSPNGVHLATGSDDHTVNIWDLRAQRIVYGIAAHSRLISTVKFAPSGSFLLTAAYDGLVRSWSARDWTAIGVHKGHADKVMCLDISPKEDQVLSCGFDKLVKVWEPENIEF